MLVGESMVGEVIRSPVGYCQVNQASKGVGRGGNIVGGVFDMQVEDDTGIGFFCPGQEALIVILYKAHCAVENICPVGFCLFFHFCHAGGKGVHGHIDFGQDFR